MFECPVVPQFCLDESSTLFGGYINRQLQETSLLMRIHMGFSDSDRRRMIHDSAQGEQIR